MQQKWQNRTSEILFLSALCLLLLPSWDMSILSCSGVAHSWDPLDCSPPGSSVHGVFQAKILEWVFLLQGIFPTQRLNLYLLRSLRCRRILYPLSHWECLCPASIMLKAQMNGFIESPGCYSFSNHSSWALRLWGHLKHPAPAKPLSHPPRVGPDEVNKAAWFTDTVHAMMHHLHKIIKYPDSCCAEIGNRYSRLMWVRCIELDSLNSGVWAQAKFPIHIIASKINPKSRSSNEGLDLSELQFPDL